MGYKDMQPDNVTIMTEMVLPSDTNALNNLRGGKLLHWMDLASAIAAQKHSKQTVVTVSVDNVHFHQSIKVGDIVTIIARVTRSFNTSMETHIEVWTENIPAQRRYKANDAYYTFVALDGYGNKVKVPEFVPKTEEEIKLFDSALRRRQLRLLLAGRIKPSEATELKELFFEVE